MVTDADDANAARAMIAAISFVFIFVFLF